MLRMAAGSSSRMEGGGYQRDRAAARTARARRATLLLVAAPDTKKRRLPVIQSAGTESGDPPREAWQWVGFGALAIFTIWLPASAVAGALTTRLAAGATDAGPEHVARAGVAIACAYGVALASGALAGGFLVGRWGTGRVGLREAAFAGLAASVVAGLASWATFGLSPGVLLVAIVTVPAAAVGGKLGLRRRARAG